MKAYEQLEKAFRRLAHLHHVSAIGNWDEAVMMPPGGAQARAEALADLEALQHELLVSDQIKAWLEESKKASLSTWQAANLKWMENLYIRASALPTDLVQRSKLAFIRCEQAWRIFRAENNWRDFLPLLEENVRLIKEIAHIKAATLGMNPYDSLIDEFSPGLSQAIIDPIFKKLTAVLPDMIQQVMSTQNQPHSTAGHFPIEKQRQIGLQLMRTIGFDFNHGRLDVSHHPFCGGVPQDVRITTRYAENEFTSALMGVCHETGHALYELNLPADWLKQPVGQALGMAVHESQSLLIEMQACRSREFMHFFSSLIQEFFGELPQFSADNLYRQFIKVQPGLIRVDADEVCYPLHVILRYELEKKLINGEIVCKDLPELWDAAMQRFFGLSTRDDYRNGVMQDVHWPSGAFGYFPAYTVGAIIAAQLFQSAKAAHPEIANDLSQGDFKNLINWLRTHIYSRGRSLAMADLIINATGRPLSEESYLNHIRTRYLV